MATTISVNGTDGVTLARSSGIRLVQSDGQALVLRNQQPATRHGRPGSNGPQAIPGGPAGSLGIQLSESTTSQGAILAHIVGSSQAQRHPIYTEVPVGRDLRLTAIGGIGESGHNGEDGEQGLDGVDGMPASRGSDATNGTDGGNGGAAGRGSSGADGGPGGDLHIVLDESSTHLLMAVHWDLRGGTGGRAAHHGTSGEGGKGGKGGQGWQWEEIVGYKYFCTSSCISVDPAARSSAVTRAGSHFRASSTAMIAPLRAQAVSGTNLQRFIAQAAVSYSALRTPRTDPGACKCGGGSGNCAGCDMKPIRSQFKRAPGLDGKDGEAGVNVTDPLVKGSRGEPGTMTIVVQHNDGNDQRYSSSWSLELVDFEIEDGNADGVFEPGEYLYIRRVTVRNAGGMPSPTCQIPVSLADHSEFFEQVPTEDGKVAYLPTSIPAAGEASIEVSIKVRIRPNTRIAAAGSRFSEKGFLQIRADMPWLDRRLPSFDLTKEITIAYPCGFGDFDHLSTVTQGAISKIQYKVLNFGNQPLGEDSALVGQISRTVEVNMTIPRQFGRLLSDTAEDNEELDKSVPSIRTRDVVSMQQPFRVLPEAENHKHFVVKFDLYLETPVRTSGGEPEMILVERRYVRLQISSTYMQQPNSRFLLVSNPETTERQSRAIQQFIQDSLHMEVDLCNIHQNGGLVRLPEEDNDETMPILQAYQDKTVIFLDDTFSFFDAGERKSTQLCDPSWIYDLAANNSSSLMMGTLKDSSDAATRRSFILPLSAKWEDVQLLAKASHCFTSPEEFVSSIIQARRLGSVTESLSVIAMRAKKWYQGRTPRGEKTARAIAGYLRKHLPNERFVVTHGDSERLLVFTGLPHQHHICFIETGITLRPTSSTNPTLSRLDRYSKYLIVAAVPFRQRVDLLWRNINNDASITQAIQLSILQDVSDQVNGLQTSHSKKLLRVHKNDSVGANTIMKVHLPFVADLLNHGNASVSAQPPMAIIHILQWLIALASSLKRHKSLHDLITLLMRNRPSTVHLLAQPDFTAGISTNTPAELINQISELTETPPFVLEKGRTSARQIVPETEYCSPTRWNGLVREIEQGREGLKDDMHRARRELGRMVLEPVQSMVDSAMELSA